MADMKILNEGVRVRADEVPDGYDRKKIKADKDRRPGRTTQAEVSAALAAVNKPGPDVAAIEADRDAANARAEAAEAALAELKAATADEQAAATKAK